MLSVTLLLAYYCNVGWGWVWIPQQCPYIAVNKGQPACFLGAAACCDNGPAAAMGAAACPGHVLGLPALLPGPPRDVLGHRRRVCRTAGAANSSVPRICTTCDGTEVCGG